MTALRPAAERKAPMVDQALLLDAAAGALLRTARTAASDRGADLPRGVAPERIPKADATGLAPEKSAGQGMQTRK
jgi:hypothetical protein